MTTNRDIISTMQTDDAEIPDDVFDAVKAIANEIEKRKDAGTLSKDQYKRLKAKAKEAAGKWWSDLVDAIDRLKP